MEALDVLARHAGGPRSLLSLLHAGGYSAVRSDEDTSQAFLEEDVVRAMWRSARPGAEAARAIVTHIADSSVLADLYAMDTRTSVRTTILRSKFCANDLVVSATFSRNKAVRECALAVLRSRAGALSAADALDLLRDTAHLAVAELVAERHDLTDEDLLRFLSENVRFHDNSRSVSAAHLIVKRRDLATYSGSVLSVLCQDHRVAPTVFSMLPDGHTFPRDVLKEISKTAVTTVLVDSLLFFRTSDETYYENLIEFLKSQGVDPSHTRLDQNASCPWRLLSASSLRPRTWGVAARAIVEVFDDSPDLWMLAADLMPGFTGTVSELLECLKALYPEAVRTECL